MARGREDPREWDDVVLGLSLAQVVAALLTLTLVVPGIDRIPYARGRRFPRWLVVGGGALGASVLAVICVLSVLNWSRVDPFRDAPELSLGKVLCWACYAVALLWPVLLGFTIVGYDRARRRGSG